VCKQSCELHVLVLHTFLQVTNFTRHVQYLFWHTLSWITEQSMALAGLLTYCQLEWILCPVILGRPNMCLDVPSKRRYWSIVVLLLHCLCYVSRCVSTQFHSTVLQSLRFKDHCHDIRRFCGDVFTHLQTLLHYYTRWEHETFRPTWAVILSLFSFNVCSIGQ
jgi:hypothetical protein